MISIFFVSVLVLFTAQIHAANPLEGLPKSVVDKHTALVGKDACSDDLPFGSESHELGNGAKLYIVPCMFGAYQGFGQVYITTNNDTNVQPVIVLAYNELVKGIYGTTDLGDPAFDARTKTLTAFAKGRGIGDCGQSSVSKIIFSEYGSISVKTVEVRAKATCDGRMSDWPVVFRQ